MHAGGGPSYHAFSRVTQTSAHSIQTIYERGQLVIRGRYHHVYRHPHVTRPEKLFVTLLLVITSSFFLLQMIWKKMATLIKSATLSTNVTHATDFKALPWIVSFPGKTASNSSCWRNKLKIICKFIVICAHFNNIYIWAYSIFYGTLSLLNIVNDNENWLLVFKNSDGRDFLTPSSNGKRNLGSREEKSWTSMYYYILLITSPPCHSREWRKNRLLVT
jgi:hypothetical protein